MAFGSSRSVWGVWIFVRRRRSTGRMALIRTPDRSEPTAPGKAADGILGPIQFLGQLDWGLRWDTVQSAGGFPRRSSFVAAWMVLPEGCHSKLQLAIRGA